MPFLLVQSQFHNTLLLSLYIFPLKKHKTASAYTQQQALARLPEFPMLSSTPKLNIKSQTRTLNRASSATSSSPSSAISPHHSHHHTHQIPRPKTMEDVWKDINLSSPNYNPSSDSTPNQNPNGVFQDFLNRPPLNHNKDPIFTNKESEKTTVPQPATVLSLNSGPGFAFLETSDQLLVRPNSQALQNRMTVSSSLNVPLDSDNGSSERRNKRMIKNRESAARSRARKQAYTNELELEVAHLMEENARLKRQQEQLRLAAAASQTRKKNALQRTLTAPF